MKSAAYFPTPPGEQVEVPIIVDRRQKFPDAKRILRITASQLEINECLLMIGQYLGKPPRLPACGKHAIEVNMIEVVDFFVS